MIADDPDRSPVRSPQDAAAPHLTRSEIGHDRTRRTVPDNFVPALRGLRLTAIALLVLILLTAGGCTGRRPPSPARSPSTAAQTLPPYNIVLVSFDTTRARDLGCYGYKRDTTPFLTRFARHAVLFKNAISPASWTVPAHMSIFTGLYPSDHGVVNKLTLQGKLMTLRDSIPTLPEALKARGMILGGFTGDAGVSGHFGFSRGFDTYLDNLTFGGFNHSMPAALAWLKKHGNQRFFMFLHGYDDHGQYIPPGGYKRIWCRNYHGNKTGSKKEQAKYREEALSNEFKPGGPHVPYLSPSEFSQADATFYRALYDEKIRDADARFAGFMAQMKADGLYNNTIFIILADHGDEFLEHGSIDHGDTLYQELIHVPLIIKVPGLAPRVVTARVNTMDALYTALDFDGVKPLQPCDAITLRPLMEGQPVPARPVFSETDYRLFVHKRCVIDGDYKFILSLDTHREELYNLRSDPMERTNLVHAQPAVAARLRKELHAWIASMPVNYPDYRTGAESVIKTY